MQYLVDYWELHSDGFQRYMSEDLVSRIRARIFVKNGLYCCEVYRPSIETVLASCERQNLVDCQIWLDTQFHPESESKYIRRNKNV